MIKSAALLYQMFGDAQVRLLQNVDDPGSQRTLPVNTTRRSRWSSTASKIASDPRVQAYLMGLEDDVPRGEFDRGLARVL